jgi:hypothetical protein
MSMAWMVALVASLQMAPAPSGPPRVTVPSPAPTSLTAKQTTAVVEAVVKEISEHYVVPERRAPIVAAIRAAQQKGRYAVTSPTELAARIGDDLAAAGKDKHLGMRWAPDEVRAAQTKRDPGAIDAFLAEQGRRHNQGVEELKILGGNVRYLKYTGFMWEPGVTQAAIDDAMRFLRGGDAIILDLRGNGGGHPLAVQYLVSHFMAEPGRLLMTFQDALEGGSHETRVLDKLPAGRLTGKPLYVLTDSGTASAAEEFVSHVKLFKLGTLVGRTTAGAAFNNAMVPIAPGFLLSVSVGRPVHAVSGGNWEATGIAPDKVTSPVAAFDAALADALTKLAAQTKDPAIKATYAWASAGIAARERPVTLAESELARHAGRYGDRTIRVERGVLVYVRPGRDDVTLTPMSGELFAVNGMNDRRIRFTGDAMEVLFEDGQRQKFARAKP